MVLVAATWMAIRTTEAPRTPVEGDLSTSAAELTAKRMVEKPRGANGPKQSVAPSTSSPVTVPPVPSTSLPAPAPPAPTTSTTAAPTVAVPTGVIGPWRGVYAPHGWIASPKSDDFIRGSVGQLGAAGFTHQLHNLGYLDASGALPADGYAGLGRWIEVSRQAAPDQRIVVWVSGGEDEHVDVDAVHGNLAAFLRTLVDTYQVDGILLDLEPFSADNGAYLRLLGEVRTQIPDTWIGVTAPATGDWSPAFVGAVAGPVDAITPMFYDTSLTNATQYQDLVRDGFLAYTAAAAGSADILPSLPAYAANRWHDPAIESIENAAIGLAGAGNVARAGVAVYWWWEMDQASKDTWLALR